MLSCFCVKAEDVTASANHDEPDDIQTVTVEGSIYQAADTFEDLKLPASLLQGLYTEMKFQRPSRVQGQTLPMIFAPPFLSLIAQVRWLYGHICEGVAASINAGSCDTCDHQRMLCRPIMAVERQPALCWLCSAG